MLVVQYAELNLLYEKEKMVNKISDSLYQTKVHEFFQKNGTPEAEFKKNVEVLSQNNADWKQFLTDVSRAVDSLKMMKK